MPTCSKVFVKIPADFRPEQLQIVKAEAVGKAVEQLCDRDVGEMISIVTGRDVFHFVYISLIHRASFHPALYFRVLVSVLGTAIFFSSGEGRKKSCTFTSAFKFTASTFLPSQ